MSHKAWNKLMHALHGNGTLAETAECGSCGAPNYRETHLQCGDCGDSTCVQCSRRGYKCRCAFKGRGLMTGSSSSALI